MHDCKGFAPFLFFKVASTNGFSKKKRKNPCLFCLCHDKKEPVFFLVIGEILSKIFFPKMRYPL